MKTDITPQRAIQVESDTNNQKLELAAAIYELYSQGLIAEEIDANGTPRFRPTRKHP